MRATSWVSANWTRESNGAGFAGKTTQEGVADYLFNDTPGRTNSRARRVVEALSSAYQFTVQDAIELALDEKWMDADRWRLGLERSLAQSPARAAALSLQAKTVVDRILRFDGHARAGSVAALDFWYWRTALATQPGGPIFSSIGCYLNYRTPSVG